MFPDDVVAGIHARDPDALARCYEVMATPLYRFLLARSRDPALAEDMVEATFLELVEYAPALRGGADGVRAWLFRAAANNLIDEQRKATRRGDVALDETRAAGRAAPEPGPEERYLAGERDAVVRAALARLSADQQEVLSLRFAAQLTSREVADITGRSVGAVKALQHRALAALKRILDPDHPDTGPE
ncbi:MAG TPA: sigma-70 family RNA polymerase sigma factor [Egibacteraceae bacterium]|nr:sigma-70 family RNA polymerase sigma factor [Egibacteraceae bacterium]